MENANLLWTGGSENSKRIVPPRWGSRRTRHRARPRDPAPRPRNPAPPPGATALAARDARWGRPTWDKAVLSARGVQEGRKALRILDVSLNKRGPGGSSEPPEPPTSFPWANCGRGRPFARRSSPPRVRSHRRLVLPLARYIPDSRTASAPLF